MFIHRQLRALRHGAVKIQPHDRMVVGDELYDQQPVLLPCEIDIAAADGIHHIGQRRQRSQSGGVEIARRQQDIIKGERALSSAQVRADAFRRLRSDDRSPRAPAPSW